MSGSSNIDNCYQNLYISVDQLTDIEIFYAYSVHHYRPHFQKYLDEAIVNESWAKDLKKQMDHKKKKKRKKISFFFVRGNNSATDKIVGGSKCNYIEYQKNWKKKMKKGG